MSENTLEIIKALESRRDNLWDELQAIKYATMNDEEMPIPAKEVRIIQVRALEYEIEDLRQRILELIESQK